MTFSIIGTGNIAWFLAKRLTSAGHQCMGIYGRNIAVATELAEWIQTKPLSSLADIRDGDVDACFIAISDLSIETIVPHISFEKTVLIHTAGSVSIDVLAGAAIDRAVLWPVFSILKTSLPNHRDIPCAWHAATNKAQRYVLSFAHGITDVIFEAKDEQRKWLHLSAVMCNNFVNHMLTISEQICTLQQLDYNVLHPMIAQTFEKAQKTSPYNLQTGPAIRNDATTIARHIDLLQSKPDWQHIYSALTTSIENMYKHDDTKNSLIP